jgi:hypothetical protein
VKVSGEKDENSQYPLFTIELLKTNFFFFFVLLVSKFCQSFLTLKKKLYDQEQTTKSFFERELKEHP